MISKLINSSSNYLAKLACGVACAMAVEAGAQNIFVNIRTSGTTPSTSTIAPPAGGSYSAAAPVTGTVWNNVGRTVTVPQSTVTGIATNVYTGLPLTNSVGAGLSQTLTVSYYYAAADSRTEPSTASGENALQPGGVMAEAWRNYLNASGNYFSFTISNLTASTPYGIYLYGGTTTSGQSVNLALPTGYTLANSPTNAATTNTTVNSSSVYGSLWTVSNGATNLMPQGSTWNTLYGKSDASGVFTFRFIGTGSYAYFNGFQLVPLAASGLSGLTNQTVIAGNNATLSATVTGLPMPNLQWYSNNVALAGTTNASLVLNSVQYAQNGAAYSLIASNIIGSATNSMALAVIVTPAITGLANQAVPVGTNVTLAATVSGVPTPALRWQFNGTNLTDGATGNGSTLAGSSAATLLLTNAQTADSGNYSLVASNSAGWATNSLTLTVSSGNVVPSIVGPADQTVVQTSNATFSASVAGLPVPVLQWRVNGTNLVGATNLSFTVTNALYAQNGWIYSLVASNAAGLATNSAALYVLVPSYITVQPTNLTVWASNAAAFSVTAGGVPSVACQWYRNGSLITNATGASYTIAKAVGADNGAVFSVVISNSVGVVTSSNVTLTVLSTTLTGAFLPTNGAVNISPDQPLRIVFSGDTPALAYSGMKLYVRDASDSSLFATVDTSLFQTFSTDSATVSNAFVRTEQGNNFYYMPIAVYSNVAWITLTNRFAYGKTYYVTSDTNLFEDANGAALPGITGTNTWRFATKSAGPTTPTTSTGPTNITIALDGAGDFATLQGASDWIPQNNTLKRTLTIQPGVYHDFAIFTQSRNYVTVIGAGTTRNDVQIIYPNAAYTSGSSCGLLRVETSDMYFRNLTLDNQVYLTNSLDNYGPWAGRLNTLDTTGQRLIFDNVVIKGGQDTLYTISGSAYFNRCEIWGSTDFIYGGAVAVFDQCNIVEIKSGGGPCTAPSTPYGQPYGLVFLNCTYPQAYATNGYPYDTGAANTSFMRPWGQNGMTAVINCTVGGQISPAGWTTMSGSTETTCRAREYGTTLISGGTAVNVPQVRWNAGAYWVNTVDPDYTNSTMSTTDPLLYGTTGTNNRTVVTIDTNSYTVPAIFTNVYFLTNSSYALNGWVPTVMPTITAQPTNQTLTNGQTALFTVAATGLPTPAYQWLKNSTNYPGATNATLTLTNVQSGDAGTYSAVVSNSAGSVTSSNAVLTMIGFSSPVITTQPTNQMVTLGGTAVFSVAASGYPSPAYQWLINGVSLTGATHATLTLTNVQWGDGGIYSVTVSNSAGAVVSSNAELTVLPVGQTLPTIPSRTFSVLNYGATNDDSTDDTAGIQAAINAASLAGGGTVELPAGAYLSGPLYLSNSINLQIDVGAMLQMQPYGTFPSNSSFICASKLHDIEISGGGTIDGQGAVWWATNNATSGGITRPKDLFQVTTSTNILVRDVTLQNPPGAHIGFSYVCANVTIDHININTTNPSPNTDGIDCSASNFLIENSHVSDGDDMLALGDGHAGLFTYNYTVANCLFGAGHGVSIGSYTSGGLSNLLVINCVWTNGTSGIHIKSDDDRGGLIQHLRCFNLAMTNTQIPIFLYSYYTNSGTSSGASVDKAAAYPAYPVTANTPIYRDILISNLTAVTASGNPAGVIWGKPELSISNVVMDHVNITATKYFQLYNAQGIQLIDSQITVPATNTMALYNAELIISNRTASTGLVKLEGVSTNGIGNALRLYNAQATLARTNLLDANDGLTLSGSTLVVSNNLALSSSNVVDFILGTNAATLVVKGNLALDGTNNVAAGGGFTNGTYALFTYAGSLSGDLPALGTVPAGYNYTLDTGTAGQINLVVALSSSAGSAPTNLVAVATNLQINLRWNAVTGATNYNLKRGTASGNYPAIFSGLTATNYADAGVTNAVTYDYVVSAVAAGVESTNSLEVTAAPLPSNQPTNIVAQISGGRLQLAWPADHLGWRLQYQTNALNQGLGSNWMDWPGGANIVQTNIIVNPVAGSTFFRLVYP
jgi:polygalacturonase/pectin methylesterase-like acyl-CoA thioesterase